MPVETLVAAVEKAGYARGASRSRTDRDADRRGRTPGGRCMRRALRRAFGVPTVVLSMAMDIAGI